MLKMYFSGFLIVSTQRNAHASEELAANRTYYDSFYFYR